MPNRLYALVAVCALAGLASGCSVGEDVVARARDEAVAEQSGADQAEAVDESLTNSDQPLACLYDMPVKKAARELRRMGFDPVWQRLTQMGQRRSKVPPERGDVVDVATFPGLKGGDVLVEWEPQSTRQELANRPACP